MANGVKKNLLTKLKNKIKFEIKKNSQHVILSWHVMIKMQSMTPWSKTKKTKPNQTKPKKKLYDDMVHYSTSY